MIDPALNQLYKVVHYEQLQAAMEAKQQATWVAAPNLIRRVQITIGRSLITLGERLQTPAVRGYTTN